MVIFINQLREKVGMMFGNPVTTTGGRALKFLFLCAYGCRRIESIRQQGEVIGNRTRIKVVKNKVAPPFREAEFDIMFGKGISREGDVIDLAANLDIIQKSGAWYAYEGNKIGQGRENAKQYLSEHPEVFDEVVRKVRVHFGLEQGEDAGLGQAPGLEQDRDESTAATGGIGSDAGEEVRKISDRKAKILMEDGTSFVLYLGEIRKLPDSCTGGSS